MDYQYHIAYDDGNILIRVDVVTPEIQRYDYQQKKWIEDFDMMGIFSGDIPVRSLTETEVNKIISEHN